MKITEHKVGDNIVLEVLESRLSADKAQAFKDVVCPYFAAGRASIILSLAKVDFIDSSGLGAILGVLKRMPKGSDLIICATTPAVSSMFKLTRMDRVFTICATVDEAVAALSRGLQ
jgi:anti-sigma B factor antagonist